MFKKGNSFVVRLIKGAVIGVAAMLPGASGGVLAVAMGVYTKVLNAATSLFKNFGKSVKYLLPLGIGGAIGLFATSRGVEWLISRYPVTVMWALIGMVLGGLPSLIKESNARGFKARYLIGLLIGVGIVGVMAYLKGALAGGEAMPFNGWSAAFGGALIGLGTVIPGISTSFVMIYLGIYEPFLSAFNNFDTPMLLCAAAGCLAVVAALITLVKRLFDKHYGYAYYGAMGLLLSSVALIFPGFRGGVGLVIDIAVAAACFAGTYVLCALPGGEGEGLPADKSESKNISGGNKDDKI